MQEDKRTEEEIEYQRRKEESYRIERLKAKAYGKVKNANQKANEAKASRNRAAKRRRKSN